MRDRYEWEWTALSIYKAERRRGIVHTPEYQARMAAEQTRYEAQRRAEMKAKGYEGFPSEFPGGGVYYMKAKQDVSLGLATRVREGLLRIVRNGKVPW